MKRKEVDIVDVHVTSISDRVDAFTQYPLLDGTKQYTVELTEFVCPLAGQDALPNTSTAVDNLLFELRRKHVAIPVIPVLHDHSRLVTPILSAVGVASGLYLPYGLFTDDLVQFRKNDQRPMSTPADLVSIYYVGQVTAPGASAGAVTATPIEDGTTNSKAAISVLHGKLTTEPTYVATIAGTGVTTPANGDLLRVALNPRAAYRWVAPPGGEFVAPAITTDGFAGVAAHASATTDYMMGFHWVE